MHAGPPPAATVSVALFASGSGSNVAALLEHRYTGAVRPCYRCLIGNNSGAPVMALARARGVPAYHVSRHTHPRRAAYVARLEEVLTEHGIELIVLAGYMKLLPVAIVRRWRGRILNIHPALLPRHGGRGMYGMAPHRAVLAAGEQETGVTVHWVDEEYDRGRILMQRTVPVLPADTPDTLARRVRAVEHDTYRRAVEQVAAGVAAGRERRAPPGGRRYRTPHTPHEAASRPRTAASARWPLDSRRHECPASGRGAVAGTRPARSGRPLAAPGGKPALPDRGIATGGRARTRASEHMSNDRAVGHEPIRSASAGGAGAVGDARGRRAAPAGEVAAGGAAGMAVAGVVRAVRAGEVVAGGAAGMAVAGVVRAVRAVGAVAGGAAGLAGGAGDGAVATDVADAGTRASEHAGTRGHVRAGGAHTEAPP